MSVIFVNFVGKSVMMFKNTIQLNIVRAHILDLHCSFIALLRYLRFASLSF